MFRKTLFPSSASATLGLAKTWGKRQVTLYTAGASLVNGLQVCRLTGSRRQVSDGSRERHAQTDNTQTVRTTSIKCVWKSTDLLLRDLMWKLIQNDSKIKTMSICGIYTFLVIKCGVHCTKDEDDVCTINHNILPSCFSITAQHFLAGLADFCSPCWFEQELWSICACVQ